jgi:uncharacterized membrane protein YdfJ with MMPL/SSD domain
MQALMLRLDATLRRRRRLFIAAWLALIAAALPFTLRQSENLTGGGFGVPGSQSEHVRHALAADFPGAETAYLAVVLRARAAAGAPQLRSAIARLDAAARRTANVALAARDRRAAHAAAGRRRTLIVPLRVSVNEDKAQDVASDLRAALGVRDGAKDGVATHLIGQGALWAGLQDLSKDDLSRAESIGFPLVLAILLVVFGSFTAAALPLALGFVSVLLTGALIFFLSRTMDMSVFVTNMASMIGIGVAVDYSLFVLARYREEIAGGAEPASARATAMATSGVAVAFSGATVVVSLAGLWMIDNSAIRSMALGAMLVVGVAVLASATLLPVLIRAFGARAYSRNRAFTVTGLVLRSRAPRRPGSTRPGAIRTNRFWTRWTGAVMRRPVVSLLGSAAILLTLAIPALSLSTGVGALRQFPAGNETRVGFEAAAKLAGPGAGAPVRVLAELRRGAAGDAANRRLVADLRARLARDPGIAKLAGVQRSRDRRSVVITAVPRADGESAATIGAVRRLRTALPATAGGRARIDVGGTSAAQAEVRDLISGSMWKIILFVLGLSYLVLMLLLRSVILPLKAVLVNLMSVGAAYGVLVVVFQWGWLDGFLGFQSAGHIDTLTPPLVLAVVFGLSMDYEVFLLSRIRERFDATGDSRRAVAEGLAASARTITSAALIMACVFAVFVGTGVPSIKELGLGNAVAITLDATLVRLILVPAAMELLGDWNWWLPRPLARLLPDASFESAPASEPAR